MTLKQKKESGEEDLNQWESCNKAIPCITHLMKIKHLNQKKGGNFKIKLKNTNSCTQRLEAEIEIDYINEKNQRKKEKAMNHWGRRNYQPKWRVRNEIPMNRRANEQEIDEVSLREPCTHDLHHFRHYFSVP